MENDNLIRYKEITKRIEILKIKEIMEKYDISLADLANSNKKNQEPDFTPVENTKLYEVYKEYKNIWISEEDFDKINRALNGRLGTSGFYMTMLGGKICVRVSTSFLEYVKENTFNPKYVPTLVQLDEKDWTKEERDRFRKVLNTPPPEQQSMYR